MKDGPCFRSVSCWLPIWRGKNTPVPVDSLLGPWFPRKPALMPDSFFWRWGCDCCREGHADDDNPRWKLFLQLMFSLFRPLFWTIGWFLVTWYRPLDFICPPQTAEFCCFIICCCLSSSSYKQIPYEVSFHYIIDNNEPSNFAALYQSTYQLGLQLLLRNRLVQVEPNIIIRRTQRSRNIRGYSGMTQ